VASPSEFVRALVGLLDLSEAEELLLCRSYVFETRTD
jgi:hypothetical protein